MSVALHNAIERYNVLKGPTEAIKIYLRERPNLFKVVLVANHIFRALAMIALMQFLPFSFPVNMAICFAGSLFYRMTVETNCAYKFALPAFAGSIVFPLAVTGLANLISGVAFEALGSTLISFGALIPLTAYLIYIVLTVNYDVNTTCGRSSQ